MQFLSHQGYSPGLNNNNHNNNNNNNNNNIHCPQCRFKLFSRFSHLLSCVFRNDVGALKDHNLDEETRHQDSDTEEAFWSGSDQEEEDEPRQLGAGSSEEDLDEVDPFFTGLYSSEENEETDAGVHGLDDQWAEASGEEMEGGILDRAPAGEVDYFDSEPLNPEAGQPELDVVTETPSFLEREYGVPIFTPLDDANEAALRGEGPSMYADQDCNWVYPLGVPGFGAGYSEEWGFPAAAERFWGMAEMYGGYAMESALPYAANAGYWDASLYGFQW